MPRGKIKTNSASCSATKVNSNNEDLEENSQESNPIPDLNKFKFQKKPHVKIEYEKEHPKNEVM